MPETTVRAFVAIELPAEIHEILEARQNELRGAMGRAAGAIRWTRPESVHVTLQFLGDVPVGLVDKIGGALRDACSGAKPAGLWVGGVGAFPNLGRPRVVWIGLEGEIASLRALETSIGGKLGPLGYKPDKPFQPHITLGRVRETVSPDELRSISQALAAMAAHQPAKAAFTAHSVSLMESHLQPGGSVYTQLANVRLG